MQRSLAFLIGCTGCGKGGLGRELARRIGAEIISLDSMKVYRRMDIGTAKPSAEARAEVRHHLIDVVEPSEEFSVAAYVNLAEATISEIRSRGKPILIVGGTPLYLKALTEGLFDGPGADAAVRARLHEEASVAGSAVLHERLRAVDPKTAARVHVNDLKRIVRALEVFELAGVPISSLQEQWDRNRPKHDAHLIGLRRNREDQSRRTNDRVHRMIEAGLVDEVERLLAEPLPLSGTARQAVGYAEIIEHLHGRCTLAEAVESIKINTRQFAKAQRTWLRRFPKIEWVEIEPEATAEQVVEELIARSGVLGVWAAGA